MSAQRDVRLRVASLMAAAIVLGGAALLALPRPAPVAAPAARGAHAREVDERFTQGVAMLHAKRYEYAVAAFHQVLKYAPDMPEAHVNMGFALLGLGHAKEARDFFESATTLRPMQANAYFGMAEALEAQGDLRGAIGAMRAYLHLTAPADPYRRRAEAALWEWESAASARPADYQR